MVALINLILKKLIRGIDTLIL